MFDAKKLLEALGTPAAPAEAGPATPPAPAAPNPATPKPAAAPALGAGTLLSDLIGYANQPASPEKGSADGEADAKPAKSAPPKDLTDLLLGKAQEYLKTPQGNAVATAAMVGLTKFVANSETGRKIGEKALTKGTALYNRFVKKAEPGQLSAVPDPVPSLPAPEPVDGGATALLILRSMIAAAAADGRIDDGERHRILSALKTAGIEGDGARLIERELDHPAGAAELAAAAKTPEMAVQAYTAARRVITPNTVDERVFLAHLSAALGLDPRTVATIDANAAGAA